MLPILREENIKGYGWGCCLTYPLSVRRIASILLGECSPHLLRPETVPENREAQS